MNPVALGWINRRFAAPVIVPGVALMVPLVVMPLAAAAPAGSDEPVDVGLEERIEVQFVLLDVVVLDRRGRTVPGLTAADFDLLLGFERTEIASVDERCGVGVLPDPRGAPPSRPRDPDQVIEAAEPRRIVLAFDYYHMHHAADTIDRARAGLERLWAEGDEHMIVSVGQTLRVELPFTADVDRVRGTLQRMRGDSTLYFGHYDRITERRFYERIVILLDLLDQLEGRKTVLLYSGEFLPDGFNHDPEYKRIASLATSARTAFYPVDSIGQRFGASIYGPRELHRLAVETGGRMTANTNDLGLAYARAQRDTACTYTLGFYDRRPRLNKDKRVRVYVRESGIRAIHPTSYVLRSKEKQRKALIQAARMSPEMFERGDLRVQVAPVRPVSRKRWEAELSVGLAGAPDRSETDGWEIVGVVRRLSETAVHTFRETVSLPPGALTGATVLHRERVKLRPDRYRVSIVLSHPSAETPLATNVELELPPIPAGEP